MSARTNGFWDFKSYDEKTWFRDLIYLLMGLIVLYSVLHYVFGKKPYTYEYAKLNTEQLQFINHIYFNSPDSSKTTNGEQGPTVQPHKPAQPLDQSHASASGVAAKPGATKNQINNGVATGQPPAATPNGTQTPKVTHGSPADTNKATTGKDTCPCKLVLCKRVMDYLNNIFENKIDPSQEKQISKLLCESTPQEASSLLGLTRFKVKSYFWLIGPSVYWEVVFWALFGVLCNLLFMLGAVGSNATTDLANPQTQFDSGEIFGQVAKIFYAPLCTLVVVLGYNFFKDANIVDIDSSKGLLVFAFIGGYYSSRLIALMDRLKDVLLPNSGSASLPSASSTTVIAQVKVQLAIDPSVPPATAGLASGAALNSAIVKIQAVGNSTIMNGTHATGDPDGIFSFAAVTQGSYIIQASLQVTPAGGAAVTLTGTQTGQVMSGTTPITVTLK